MEQIFNKLLDVFSVEFIFTIIFAAYFAIRVVEYLCAKHIKTGLKKIITVVVGILATAFFVVFTDTPKQTLLVSYFAALFFYDYTIKWLLKKLSDYRK